MFSKCSNLCLVDTAGIECRFFVRGRLLIKALAFIIISLVTSNTSKNINIINLHEVNPVYFQQT